MEDYLSEREQIERLRRTVRENAPWAIAGVLIGVGALVGWQQWGSWRERQSLSASENYTQVLDALSRNDGEAASRLATQLGRDYARTPYADLATLALARAAVESGRFADAARQLEQVMNGSRDGELRLIARLRLARVQRADGKLDAALATLAAAPPAGGHGAAFAEVRGDVLRDKGDPAGAQTAYRAALDAPPEAGVNRELLELKSATTAPAAAGAAGAPGVTGATSATGATGAAGARP